MKVGIAILSLCIAVAQLAPLAIIPYMAGRKAGASVTSSTTSTVDNSGKPSREELKVSPEDQVAVSITPNSSIELIGYGSIGYNAGLFTVDSAVSTDTSKTIIYKDNKTRVTFGFVTDLSAQTDIPGYIMNKVAGVSSVTNDKEKVEVPNYNYKEKEGESEEEALARQNYTWMKIKADKEIDGQIVYVYYLLSANKSNAMWFRANVDKDFDISGFEGVIKNMLPTANVYYTDGTVFDTPNGGYYENNKPDDGTGKGQGDYKENTEDNKIYNGKKGFIKADDVPKNWDSLTVKIGDDKLSIPAVLSEYIAKGYKIDVNKNSITSKDKLGYGLKITDLTLTKGNIVVNVDIMNNTRGEDKSITDCRVVALRINQKDFKYIADIADDYIVLPGGITFPAYTNDIIDYYGPVTYNESDTGSGDNIRVKRLTWVKGEKSMSIITGVVANITGVEFSIADSLEPVAE